MVQLQSGLLCSHELGLQLVAFAWVQHFVTQPPVARAPRELLEAVVRQPVGNIAAWGVPAPATVPQLRTASRVAIRDEQLR